jgi:hypothetical protein
MTAPHPQRARHLAEFFQGYLRCALWSSTDEDGDHLDAKFDSDDFSPAARGQSEVDCIVFFTDNEQDLYDAWRSLGFEFSSAGHDFWLTRNGHGAGFWDRDELKGGIGKRLTKSCRNFKEVDLYVGDDGKVRI